MAVCYITVSNVICAVLSIGSRCVFTIIFLSAIYSYYCIIMSAIYSYYNYVYLYIVTLGGVITIAMLGLYIIIYIIYNDN